MYNMKNQTIQAVKVCLMVGGACFLLSLFSGCGSGSQGPQGNPGQDVTTTTPSPTPDAVQTIVDGYNEYLVSQGQDLITPGLRCTLYNVPNMPATPCLLTSSIAGCSQISSSTGYTTVATFTYTGQVNQPDQVGTAGFNLLPQAFQGLYSANFAVTCTGYFVNTDYQYHSFDLASDDGSLLYIGGTEVVQNDGLHGSTDVKGEKYLEAEVYSFQLNYFQGPGYVELILNEDGALLPAANLYH
jgi:hypothetical protein